MHLAPYPARRLRLAAVAALAVAVAAAVPVAAANSSGFRTSQSPMLVDLAGGPSINVEALITVGETLPGGYLFEAIPDGIAFQTRGQGRVDVFVNHETSTVPFPWAFTGEGTAKARPTAANSQNDFVNSELSRLVINAHSGGILSGRKVIESSENYHRFCSNYLATEAEGFDRPILFTNEEANAVANREGVSFPTFAGGSRPEQLGVVVAYDPQTGRRAPIYGMGRHNHENSVAIPGFSQLLVASGDDTFDTSSASAPNSQLYFYTAPDTDAIWADTGQLWGLKVDDTAVTTYYTWPAGATRSVSLVPIPKSVAQGDQAALESYSNANGVFRFLRIEDIAYDRSDPTIVYLADSGRGSGAAPNGRIWKLDLAESASGTITGQLSVLVDGDGAGSKAPGAIHQPDNLETTPGFLYVTEDPSSGNQFNPGEANATNARIWRVPTANPAAMQPILAVDQSADGGPSDVDGFSNARMGAWEASGIIDASAAFGPGAFLVDVQAHSLWVAREVGPDLHGDPNDSNVAARTRPDGIPDWTYKREGGQLLLIRISG